MNNDYIVYHKRHAIWKLHSVFSLMLCIKSENLYGFYARSGYPWRQNIPMDDLSMNENKLKCKSTKIEICIFPLFFDDFVQKVA